MVLGVFNILNSLCQCDKDIDYETLYWMFILLLFSHLNLSVQFGRVPPVDFSALNQVLLGFLGFAIGQQPAGRLRQPPEHIQRKHIDTL